MKITYLSRIVNRLAYTVTIMMLCCNMRVHAEPIESYIPSLPDGANLALIVQKIGSKKTPLINYHADRMALPASTQKVLTALAALLQLGVDFRFTTTLESPATVTNGALSGDLIIRFSGDPTLTRQQLRDMITTLKKTGIRRITGNFIVDTSVFSSHDMAPGWSWNDTVQCFSTPPAAAIVDRNCFFVSLQSAQDPGNTAFVEPYSYPVQVSSEVRTLAKGSVEAQYCELDIVPGELNQFTLRGCLTRREDPIRLAIAIQNGASYAGAILKNELKKAGIQLDGHLRQQTIAATTFLNKSKPKNNILAQVQSAPLPQLLKAMLKKSDNLIADSIFRTIGHQRFDVPGTWRAGANAVRQVLREKARIDLGNSIVVDGSGLSRHNLLSPTTMMQVLQYIAQNDKKLNIISMLPLSGHDGTLLYRGSLHEAGVTGKVSAKTGALQGVYNLAGFITTASGQRMAFVQFLSGYAVPPEAQRNRRVPLLRFESRLYKDIYKNN